MATQLKRMKIREISSVDEPASPGAYIILAKRRGIGGGSANILKYNENEPRIEAGQPGGGRWTSGGVGATALKVARTVGSAIRAPVDSVVAAAKKHAIDALTAAGGVGADVAGTKLKHVAPVKGGGVHFHFETPTRGRTITTKVQIRPEHVRAGGAAHKALQIAHTILSAYNVNPEDAIQGRFHNNSMTSGLAGNVGATTATSSTPAKEAGLNPAGKVQTEYVYVRNPMAALAMPVRDNPEPAGNLDALKPQQWYDSPENDHPINVIPNMKTGSGAILPLNHPSITHKTSGGHSYITAEGDYIPSMDAQQQRYVHDALSNDDIYNGLHHSNPNDSHGSAYITREGDVVPAGGRTFQSDVERQYRGSKSALASMIDRAKIAGKHEVPLPEEHTKQVVVKNLFKSKSLFDEPKQLFGEPATFFLTKYNPSHDERGRFASGMGAAAGAKIGKLVQALKHPAVKSFARGMAEDIPRMVAGTVGFTGMHLPDQEATDLAHHVNHAIQYGTAAIKADPRFQKFAQKLGSKLFTSSRYLFRKSDGSALTATQHAELKGHIARVLSKMPIHPKVAANDAALAAMCKGVHDRLCQELSH